MFTGIEYLVPNYVLKTSDVIVLKAYAFTTKQIGPDCVLISSLHKRSKYPRCGL